MALVKYRLYGQDAWFVQEIADFSIFNEILTCYNHFIKMQRRGKGYEKNIVGNSGDRIDCITFWLRRKDAGDYRGAGGGNDGCAEQ